MFALRVLLLTLLLPSLAFAAPLRTPQGGTGTEITPALGAIITSDGSKYFGDTPWASVKAFGAVGNGIANDTAAIQATLTARDTFFPPGTYLINATLTVPSNRKIFGANGAILKLADSTNLPMIQLSSSTDVTIEGLWLNGNQTNQSSCSGGCRGIVSASGPARVKILHNTITNTRNDAIYFAGLTQSAITGNYIGQVLGETLYGSGIVVTGTTANNQFITITGNTIENIGGAGIAVTGRDMVVADNIIYDTAKTIAAQAILVGYIDALRVVVANNMIHTTTLHGCMRLGGQFLTAIGNTVYNCGERGIVGLTTNDGSLRGYHIRILDNTIINPTDFTLSSGGASGVHIGACDYCDVLNNHVRLIPATPYNGIVADDSVHVQISNNQVENGAHCVRLSTLTWALVSSNHCTGQTVRGMVLLTPPSSHVSVTNNQIGPLGGAAVGGIVLDDTSATDLSIIGNTVVDAPPTVAITGTNGTWATGNYVSDLDCNITGAATLNPNGRFVACDIINVGSTGNITAVTAGAFNRRLTLEFLAGGTLIDGGNLTLNSDFGPGAGGTITLISQPPNWVEVSRSDNN